MDSPAAQAAISKRLAELRAADSYLAKLYNQYGLPPIEATPMKPKTKEELIAATQAEKKRLGISN